MKTTRIVTVTVLMVASVCTLHVLWAKQAVNTSGYDNRGAVPYDERKGDHAD
jgi:hypothetical protein